MEPTGKEVQSITETERSPIPEEEDETMEEFCERPSPSPPAETDQDQLPVSSEESNSSDHVKNVNEVITDGQRMTKEEQDTLAAQKMALKMGILPSSGSAVIANFRPNSAPIPKRKSRWDIK